VTTLRPEEGGGRWGSEEDPRPTAPGAYEAAVDALHDPLTDPLPDGYATRRDGQYEPYHPQPYDAAPPADEDSARAADPYATRNWFEPDPAPAPDAPAQVYEGYERYDGYESHKTYPPTGAHPDGAHSDGAYAADPYPADPYPADASAYAEPYTPDAYEPDAYDPEALVPPPLAADPLTADPLTPGAYDAEAYDADGFPAPGTYDPETIGLRRPADLREAGRTGRRPADAPDTSTGTGTGTGPDGDADADADTDTGPAPRRTAGGTRLERRKAEKARKATRANKIANVIGELMITTGALLMLFVTYQLWWTNVEARAHANSQARQLLEGWGEDGPGEPAPPADPVDPGEEVADPDQPLLPPPNTEFDSGEGFALLHLPTISKRVPIAEGVGAKEVLDRGLVGRYSEEDGLPTAMPWDEEGNVGLAAHRNTHGEPFRYINKLTTGDPIVIETETAYYLYEVRTRLDSTSPSNIQVLDPIPTQGGFTGPGRYVTLTTCTPEYTSTYRLIIWGELVEERPRSEGEPDALAD
jgi:sortase A